MKKDDVSIAGFSKMYYITDKKRISWKYVSRVNSYILHTAGNQKLEFQGGNDKETQNFLKVVRKQINE